MRRAMVDTVDEVGVAAAAAGIDCDFVRGGTVVFARSDTQWTSAQQTVETAREYGVDALELWGADQVRARDARGAVYDPACARVHPAALVRGLARVVEKHGAVIHEQTTVESWESGLVRTNRGVLRARHIISALEGYGATIAQTKRRVLPLYSLMVATQPLDDAVWDSMGIAHGQTFSDGRHLVIYGQRTADNRIAFGGRGARYHWGSAIRSEYDRVERVFEHLVATLHDLFPQLPPLDIEHAWGGPLGVPRDWHASVSDRKSVV